jgi:hypothetical protein
MATREYKDGVALEAASAAYEAMANADFSDDVVDVAPGNQNDAEQSTPGTCSLCGTPL